MHEHRHTSLTNSSMIGVRLFGDVGEGHIVELLRRSICVFFRDSDLLMRFGVLFIVDDDDDISAMEGKKKDIQGDW